jgi:WD40 repeat protein
LTDDETHAWAIAIAPNGKTFAIAELYAVSVRDLATGRELVHAEGHREPVRILAVSPNGRTVATAIEQNSDFLIWDVATCKPVLRLKGFDGRPRFCAFSPDGTQLFGASYENLMAWNAIDGRTLFRRLGRRLSHEDASVCGTAASPDGKFLAWAGDEKAIVLLDAATGKELRQLEVVGRNIEGLAFSQDGGTLLGWASKERLHSWNTSSGERHDRPCKGLPEAVRAIAFSPDLKFAAFGGQNPFVAVVNLATGAEYVRIDAVSGEHAGAVNCAAFSPDGRTLAWAGPKDGIVRLTELATGKERRRLVGHHCHVNSLAFSADGKVLVTGGDDTTCLVWDVPGQIGPGRDRPAALTDAVLSSCWANLRTVDATKAYVALRQLIADPSRAVPFLALRLRPIAAAETKRVARLLADLDSEEFSNRDEAARELEKIGEMTLPALRKVLAGKASLEMRRRVEQLVDKLEPLDGERLRSIRAIETLEHIGSPEARQVLLKLAQGALGARQTDEATAALHRLGKRGVASP